jgi:long-chain acyl-CoA synthetase
MEQKFTTLADLYEKAVKQYANRPFMGVKKGGQYQWMTYKDFGDEVEAARAGLASLGVKKGDRIAVIADNTPPWAVMAFASYGLGAIYVPMYQAQLASEWEFIINDCQAKVILAANGEVAEKCLPIKKNVSSVEHIVAFDAAGGLPEGVAAYDALLDTGRKNPVPMSDVKREDLADFIYTSGTTGKPKGVMLSHGNIVDNINAIHAAFPFSPDGETSLAFLPWAHAFGQVAEVYTMFSIGGKIGLAEAPTTLIANLSEVRPTILMSVPRVWNKVYSNLHKKMTDAGGLKQKLFYRALAVAAKREKLAEQGRSSFLADLEFKVLDKLVFSKIRDVLGGNLKFAVSGAAALSPEVARFVSYVGITVCEGYGLTETSPAATFNRPGEVRFGTVGTPIPGVEISILPVENAPEGQGEIVIKGHNIMQGYYNREEATKEVMLPDGGFRTGDLGFIDADGYLHITGRVKEQFKLENGKYVAPAPLEEALKLSPYIGQAFIHGANKPYNVALIVPNPDNMPDWAAQNGLGGKSLEELAKEPSVRKLIEGEIKKYSTEFKGFERVQNFAVVGEEFTTDNGLLTPTMKTKRQAIMNKYGDLIESLFSKSGVGV